MRYEGDNNLRVQSNVMIEVGTENEAIGSGYKELDRRFPQKDGWISRMVLTNNIPKNFISRLLESAEE